MNPETEVQRLLTEHGATLKRSKKHLVYQFPDGKTFTIAATPSDHRAALNQLTDLKKLLGIKDPARGEPGERREKKPVRQARKIPVERTIASQLQVLSVADDREALKDEIAALQSAFDTAAEELRRITAELAFWRRWFPRVRRFWGWVRGR